jgi:hypothetical protein
MRCAIFLSRLGKQESTGSVMKHWIPASAGMTEKSCTPRNIPYYFFNIIRQTFIEG